MDEKTNMLEENDINCSFDKYALKMVEQPMKQEQNGLAVRSPSQNHSW